MAVCVSGGTSAITEENKFFFRICQLLIDFGTTVMRNEFNKKHPPHTLDTVLQVHEKQLKKLPKKVLTVAMWNVLYPTPSTYGNCSDFDITLLSVLFRNICSLNPPVVDVASGRRSWDEDPLQNDHSLEADLVRLKLFRNRIYAHAKSFSMSATEFRDIWTDVSQVLVRRDPSMQNDIDTLQKIPFTELERSYSQHLEDWYRHEQEVKEQLDDIHNIAMNTLEEVKSVMSKLEEVKSAMSTFDEVKRQGRLG